MASLASTAAELLRSGDYSDLTLVCEGKELRVHKSIVCPQSPVIAAALKGEFKEAKTNTIEVNFELATLECMLEYMYTGDYEKKPTQSDQPSQLAQPAHDASIKETKAEPTTTILSQELLHHARVNSIADYYAVTSLAQASATRVQTLLNGHWPTDAFLDILQEVTGLTGDKNIRKALADTAGRMVYQLMGKDFYFKGVIPNDMASEVLKASIDIFRAQNSEVKQLKAEILTKNAEIARLRQELKELFIISNRLRYCTDATCNQFFGWTVEKDIKITQDRSVLRCAKCKGWYTLGINGVVRHTTRQSSQGGGGTGKWLRLG